MATERTGALVLDSPELLAAARAAGYRSRRLGPALYVLDRLAAARGDERAAMALIHADVDRTSQAEA